MHSQRMSPVMMKNRIEKFLEDLPRIWHSIILLFQGYVSSWSRLRLALIVAGTCFSAATFTLMLYIAFCLWVMRGYP